MASNSTAEIELTLALLRHTYKLGANELVSPYSVRSALMMLLEGTGGESRAQIIRTLFGATNCTEENIEKHVKEFTQANASLLDPTRGLVRMANLLYTHVTYPLNPNFTARLFDSFKARATELDFVRAPEQARLTINQDVAAATSGKIPTLLIANLQQLTRLVLINTIHFRAKWKSEFTPSDTQERHFYKSGQKDSIDVRMMAKKEHECPFYYNQANKTRAIRLVYKGEVEGDGFASIEENHFSAVFILPHATVPMETFLSSMLTPALLEEILTQTSHMNERQVNIHLPRFKFTREHHLGSALRSVGIKDVFDKARADFSPALRIPQQKLMVSDAIQKVLIDVNEEGTEAAVATAASFVPCCDTVYLCKPVDFIANRPFLFLLVGQTYRSGKEQILFIGAVEDPTAET